MPNQSEFRKKSRQALKIVCQSHNIQYIKLKENGNFKMGNIKKSSLIRPLDLHNTMPNAKLF